jgi:AAA15 family ATPase/GTPase
MLLEFSVGNFRSFKERVTLSMVASHLTSKELQPGHINTFAVNGQLTLLTSAAIYGANAGGKSNLVKALSFMRRFVLVSSKSSESDEPIEVHPFLLDTETEGQPSYFEIVFRMEGIHYRYGFEVTREKVISEWLFYSPKGREAVLFLRDEGEFELKRAFREGKPVVVLTRPNALFLSVAAQFNGEISSKVVSWFKALGIVSGLDDRGYRGFTANKFAMDDAYRARILDLILNSDVGINDIQVETSAEPDLDFLPKEMPQDLKDKILADLKDSGEFLVLKSVHEKKCHAGDQQQVFFDLSNESHGTQKLFFVAGPVIDTLQKGGVLVIDEIEARLHTLLTRKIIGLFNAEITNPKHAQLIFATHDTNLLSNKLFRRDQIWFVEKDESGASHLYSLAELRYRSERSFENDYLSGRYGGIPILGEMRQMVLDLDRVDTYEEE